MEQRHIIDALAELKTASSDVYGCMRQEAGVWHMNKFSGVDTGKALERLGVALNKSHTILDAVDIAQGSTIVPTLSIWDKIRREVMRGIAAAMRNKDPHTYQALKSINTHINRCEQQNKKEQQS